MKVKQSVFNKIAIAVGGSLLVGAILVGLHFKQVMDAANQEPQIFKIDIHDFNNGEKQDSLFLDSLRPATYRVYLFVYKKQFNFPLSKEEYRIRDSISAFLDTLFRNANVNAYLSLETMKGQIYSENSEVRNCVNMDGYYMRVNSFNIPHNIPRSPRIKMKYKLTGNLEMIGEKIDSMEIRVGVYGSWK